MTLKEVYRWFTEDSVPWLNRESVLCAVRNWALRANTTLYDAFWYNNPFDVMAADWDTLVLLDGCRHDLFEDVIRGRANWPNESSTRISRGSSSGEFIAENIVGREFHDTIYITANPHVHEIPAGTFYAVFDLLNDDQYYDNNLQTVRPETMQEKTLQIAAEHPNKRLLVHFMQPHYPFIGESGRELESDRGVYGKRSTDVDVPDHIWRELKGQLRPDLQTVWQAYRETLELTLPYVHTLAETLNGKTVISTDHGNLVGDRLLPFPARSFGHPPRTHVPPLVNVPWLELEHSERREISEDEPLVTQQSDTETPEDRLKALGYR